MILENKQINKLAFQAGVASLTPPDFRTHSNYVRHFNKLSKGLSATFNRKISKAKVPEPLTMYKKIQLAELTYKSIVGENEEILKNSDYSQICVSWISVKSYYLIFNLLVVLEYLITLDENSFNYSHKKMLKKIKDRVANEDISFSKINLMQNFSCPSIQDKKIKTGSNLAFVNYTIADRFILILKKLIKYKVEEFKRENSIEDFRKKCNKEKLNEFLKNEKVNVIEFFYWYRIKANYRDLEFLNHSIDSEEFSQYFSDFFELTLTFRKCLGIMINRLSQERFGKSIIPSLGP